MPSLSGIDHVAITVQDIDQTFTFYDRLFGAEVFKDIRPAVQVIIVGGGVRLSVHQAGNGVDLVATKPTPGSADLCFRWESGIADAIATVTNHGVEIIEGPTPRETLDRRPAQSIYFKDPDGNLIELLAPN